MLDGTKYTGTTEGSYGSVVGLLEGSVIWEGTGDGGIGQWAQTLCSFLPSDL